MILSLTCNYCGHEWSVDLTYQKQTSMPACYICGDRNVVAKDQKKSKIDYYAGSPPFQDKPAEDDRANKIDELDYAPLDVPYDHMSVDRDLNWTFD